MKRVTTMPIPRHRPGRRSKAANLPALVASAATDPLAGNYTLVPANDIVATFLTPGCGNVTVQAFPLSGSSGSDMTISSGATLSGVPSSTFNLPVASAVGRFTAGAQDSIALVQINDYSLGVSLATFDDQTDAFTQVLSGTLLTLEGTATVLVAAAGYFTGTATAQLAVLYSTITVGTYLSIWDLSGSSPSQVANTQITANNAALCTGDFDGDGYDEIAVADTEQIPWLRQTDISFDIFKIVSGGLQTRIANHSVGVAMEGAQFAIASGTFPVATGSGITGEQLAIAWMSPAGALTLTVFPFVTTSGFSVGTSVDWIDSTTIDPTGEPSFSSLAAIATADLDLDGYDEIAVAYITSETSYTIFLFDYSSNETLNMTSSGSQDLGSSAFISGLSLAAGPVTVPNSDSGFIGTNAVVVAVQTGENVVVGFVPVSTSNLFPTSFTAGGNLTSSVSVSSDLPTWAFTSNQVVVALGDFSGKSIVVGSPTATTLEAVNGLVAVVNIPPYVPMVNSSGTSAEFQTQQQQQTSLSLAVSSSWSTSDSLHAKLGIPGIAGINASMTATYGAGFTNVGSTTTLLTTQVAVNAQTDDEILLSVTDYNFWEYPVYQGAPTDGAEPIGYLMVTWPENPTLGSWAGLNLNSFYNPAHQIGDIGSYPAVQPADVAQELFYSPMETTVGTEDSLLIMMTTLTNQSASTTSSISINQTMGISGILKDFLEGVTLGVAAQFHDTYTQNSISTHQVGFTDSTVIIVTLGPLPSGGEDNAYMATPLLYWSSTDGHLVLDYVVSWGDGTNWSTQLAPANPTFTLPWATQSSEWQQLTRCIAFVPQTGAVDIVATIWNFGTAPVSAGTVQAQFYLGDPEDKDTIGGTLDVPAIPARSSATVAQSWTPPSDLTVTNPGYVYCVLSAAAGSTYANLPVTGMNVYPPDYFSQVSLAAATKRKAQYDAVAMRENSSLPEERMQRRRGADNA